MPEIPIYARIPVSVSEALGYASDNDFAIAMSNLLFAREAEVGYGALTVAERVVFCLDGLEREVNNGGFQQFFLNSSGDHCGDTPSALRSLGAPITAGVVEKALELFPDGGPPADGATRSAQVGEWGPKQQAVLERLDAAFLKYPEPLARLERAYVSAHQDEFQAPKRGGQSLVI